jgi:catechol 2,3-dioxygenase-like lactoylglutathione lyase family enzyme
MEPKIVGLDHIVLVTPDVERSLAWYHRVLGLAEERADEWRRGEVPFPSVRVDASTIIDLLLGMRSGVNVDHLCFVIEHQDLAALAAAGLLDVVAGPAPRFGAQGVGESVYVYDPDGNLVELRHYGA